MTKKVNTYLADTCGTKDAETLKRLKIQMLPEPENFLQIGDVRRLAEEFRLRVYAVTSLGTWRMDGQYLGIDGSVGKIGESDPSEFFHHINNARFELAEKEETTPDGELWYAKLGGHFMGKLVPHLKENANLFNGVKIGAFVPKELDFTDPKYNELWEFCNEKAWPVLIHCSKSNPETFSQVLELAKKYPNARFCASHLGGENREFIEARSSQISQMPEGLPENFFLNIAVRDLSLVRTLQERNPDILKKIVYATDVPFMGSYGEVNDRNQAFFTPEELDTITANGRRFLSGDKLETETASHKPSTFEKLKKIVKIHFADHVLNLIGFENLPEWIRKDVPVYRAVHRNYAGKPNRFGEAYFVIGSQGKSYSQRFLFNHPGEDYVLIRTTFGELMDCGEVSIVENSYGFSAEVKMEHDLGNFEIIDANKIEDSGG